MGHRLFPRLTLLMQILYLVSAHAWLPFIFSAALSLQWFPGSLALGALFFIPCILKCETSTLEHQRVSECGVALTFPLESVDFGTALFCCRLHLGRKVRPRDLLLFTGLLIITRLETFETADKLWMLSPLSSETEGENDSKRKTGFCLSFSWECPFTFQQEIFLSDFFC